MLIPERMRGAPRSIQAAYLRSLGCSYEEIAEHFNWRVNTAVTSVARGKKWRHYMNVGAAGNNRRRRADVAARRPDKLVAQLRQCAAEMRALGMDPHQVLADSNP